MIRELLVPGYKELKEEVKTLRKLSRERCEEVYRLTKLIEDLQSACLTLGTRGDKYTREFAAKAVAESQEYLGVPILKGHAYPWFRDGEAVDTK